MAQNGFEKTDVYPGILISKHVLSNHAHIHKITKLTFESEALHRFSCYNRRTV